MATGTVKSETAAGSGQVVYSQIRATQRYVKWVELGSSLMLMLAIVVGFLLTMVLVDHWIFSLGTVGRSLAFLVLVGGLGTYFGLVVAPYLFKPINPLYAAKTIEKSTPTLKNSLINFLFLRSQAGGVHKAVLDAVEQRAAADVSAIRVESTVDRTRVLRVGYLLIALFAFGGLYTVLSPQDPLQSVYRIAMPWANIDRPTRTRIVEITPGDVTIVQGKHVQVTAKIDGADPKEVVVLLTAQDASFVDRVIEMRDLRLKGETVFSSPNLSQSDAGIQQSLFYRVRAGDALSPEYQIKVRIAPIIEVDRIEYDFPPYTGRQKVVLQARGDIRALEGTRVTIHAKANEAIKSAFIDLYKGIDVQDELMKATGKKAVGRFTLEMVSHGKNKAWKSKFQKYRLRFENEDGIGNDRSLEYRIDVIRDLVPVVEVLDPKTYSVEVPEDGEQTIEVRAVDSDFGLTEIKLVAQAGDLTVLDQKLWQDVKGQLGQVIRTYRFSPRKLKLVAGDRVVLWAKAADNRTHPISRSPQPNVAQTRAYTITVTAPQNNGQGKDSRQLNNNPGKPIDPNQGSKKKKKPNPNPSQNNAGKKDQSDGKSQKKDKNQKQQQGKNKKQKNGSGSAGDGDGKSQAKKQEGDQKGGAGQKSDSKADQDQNKSGSGGGGGESGNDNDQKNGGQNAKQGKSDKKSASSKPGGGGEKTPKGGQPKDRQNKPDGQQSGQKQGGQGERQSDEHLGDKLDRVLKHRQKQGEKGNNPADKKAGQKDPDGQNAGRRRGKDNGGKQDDGTGTSRLTDPMGRKKPEGTQQAGSKKGNNRKSKADESEPGKTEKRDAKRPGPQGSSQKQKNTKGQSENHGNGKKQQSDTGNSGSPMGNRQDTKKKAGQGTKKGGKKQAGGGKATSPGAGRDTKKDEGAGGSDNKLQDKKKTQKADNKGSDSKEPQSALGKDQKKSTDSKGESSGDRAGGGGKSKGQNANSGGNDSAGGNRSSDRGAGVSKEGGQGELSSGRGKQQVASSKTGEKGSQKGQGTYSRQGKKGERSNNKRKSTSKAPNKQRGSGGAPKGGGVAADRPPEKFDNNPKKPIGQSRENVEFAKQQTNLALEHLKKQMSNPKALKDMKLSKDEANQILDYFSKLKSQAKTNPRSKSKLNDVFKSLGLRPKSFSRRQGKSRSDNRRGNVQAGRSGGPPASYRELWNASRTRTK